MPVLICSACGSELTKAIEWGTSANHNMQCEMQQAAVDPGWLVRLGEEDWAAETHPDGTVKRKIRSPAGAISTNPADVLADRLVSCGADNGCCGSDGCDGPNRCCSTCGQVLATQWSDCWTQAEVRFLPDAVSEIPRP